MRYKLNKMSDNLPSLEAIHLTLCMFISGELGSISQGMLNKVCDDLLKKIAETEAERSEEKRNQCARMIDSLVLTFENKTYNHLIHDINERAITEIMALPYYLIAAFCSRRDDYPLCSRPEMTEFGKSVFRSLNPVTISIVFGMLSNNSDYYVSDSLDDLVPLFKYITQEQNAEYSQAFRNLCAGFIAAFFLKKRPGYDDMINAFTPTFAGHPNYNDLQSFAAALYDDHM